MMLSILHVSQPTDAGVALCVATLVADQAARGWRVSVACPSEGALADRVREAGAEHIGWMATRSPGPSVVKETVALKKILREADADLVHLHSSKAGLAGRLALRGRRPTVFHPNGWSFYAVTGPARRAAIAWERLSARWANVIVCVSEEERLGGERAGICANWRIIPNAIDLTAFPKASSAERAEARRRFDLDDEPVVVCVGRVCRQKGQDVLLDAWHDVRRRVRDAQLLFVGDGPDRLALADRSGPGVRFVGQRDDVAEWLGAADVVAMPSRWEGMSFTMLEAMGRGRSVVATDVAGAREGLGGEAGAIVPVEDPGSLAEAIIDRLLDPRRAEEEGAAGRRRVVQSHDAVRMSEEIACLYEDLLQLPSRSNGPRE